MSFNLWQPKGSLSGMTSFCNPQVIYEGSPQILAGPNVFKMWAGNNNGTIGINYFESADGISWTASGSNPVTTGSNSFFPTIFKNGSTYYLYTGGNGSVLSVQTSTNGITWGSKTTILTLGSAGQWDDTHIYQLNIIPGLGPPFIGYYEGDHTHSALGVATSPDLINWTKAANNPVIDFTAPCTFLNVGGTYYLYTPGFSPAALATLGYNGLQRLWTTSPTGPWHFLTLNGTVQNVLYCSVRGDFDYGGTGSNPQGASIGDPCIVNALGNLYMYWTRTTTPGFQAGVNLAIAPNTTPAQLVKTYEGVQGFPLPFPGFNMSLNQLASDNFTRANANPIGGNWTPLAALTNFGTAQIASNLCESSNTTKNGDSYWNAASFPNDQYSQVTVQTDTSAFTGADIRMDNGGVGNAYRAFWSGGASGLGNAGTLDLQYLAAGASSALVSMSALIVNQGDTITLVSSGTNLLAYQNGTPVLALTDSNLTSGSPGFMVNPNSGAVTTSQISAWQAGGLIAPSNPPSVGGGNITHQQLRKWRNG